MNWWRFSGKLHVESLGMVKLLLVYLSEDARIEQTQRELKPI